MNLKVLNQSPTVTQIARENSVNLEIKQGDHLARNPL